MSKTVNRRIFALLFCVALCGFEIVCFSENDSAYAQEKPSSQTSAKAPVASVPYRSTPTSAAWEDASTWNQGNTDGTVDSSRDSSSDPSSHPSQQSARFRNRPNPIRLVRTQEDENEDDFDLLDEEFSVDPEIGAITTFEDSSEAMDFLSDDEVVFPETAPKTQVDGTAESGTRENRTESAERAPRSVSRDASVGAAGDESGWETESDSDSDTNRVSEDGETTYYDEFGREIDPSELLDPDFTAKEPFDNETDSPPAPRDTRSNPQRRVDENESFPPRPGSGSAQHDPELQDARKEIEEQLKRMQHGRTPALPNTGGLRRTRPSQETRPPQETRPSPGRDQTGSVPEPPTPEPLRPTPARETADSQGAPVSGAIALSRSSRECVIGPPVAFRDQFGWHPDIAPVADFLVENPRAPLFDMGITRGRTVFGYETDFRLTERPYGWLFDNMQLFVGGSGFGMRHGDIEEKSFGFFEGVNWSGTISPRLGMSAQLGMRAVQRTIDGSHPAFGETDWQSGGKGQVFITAGFFKRAGSMPFQLGVVYDWMNDTKYENKGGAGNLNVGQIRAEFSYAAACGWTFGFRGAFGGSDDDPFDNPLYRVETTNRYLGFFETELWCGSLLSFQAGGTKEGNAILGLCYDQPLYDKFSIKTEFHYMLQKDDSSIPDTKDRDGWEAMITLTFHPHGGAFTRANNPLRALFDVAGNGTMFLSHKRE